MRMILRKSAPLALVLVSAPLVAILAPTACEPTRSGRTSPPDDTTGAGGSTGSGGDGGDGAGSGGSGAATGSGGTLGEGGAGAGGNTGLGGSVGGGGSGGNSGSGGNAGAGGGAGSGGTQGSNPTGPCDIYQMGNTPCAAAHSTVRALYSTYNGPLYQVQRASDKTTKDIPVGPGGFANVSTQDSFCSGTTCTIPIIYDQSANGNHLRVTWFSYWLQTGGNPADAYGQKITVSGHTVYGIKVTGFGPNIAYRTGVPLSGTATITKGSASVTFSSPQTLPANTPLLFVANAKDCPANSFPNNCNFHPYLTAAAINNSTTVTLTAAYTGTSSSASPIWNHATKGLATGDQAEAMYSVFDGARSNQYCCFDYGNAELDGFDEGNATMEAIYFGSDTQFGQSGGGNGPWVAADLENGMFEGYENGSTNVPSNTSITGFPYVTAMLKGLAAKDCPSGLTTSGCFELKAGNATTGKLAVKFNANTGGYGPRPPGFSPQKKQGAIILGTGGDGSQGGTGTWFEGAITFGAPPDATDDAVQANIVAIGYGK
jgi:Alpha-L-arabinofuranosidase B, catalytic